MRNTLCDSKCLPIISYVVKHTTHLTAWWRGGWHGTRAELVWWMLTKSKLGLWVQKICIIPVLSIEGLVEGILFNKVPCLVVCRFFSCCRSGYRGYFENWCRSLRWSERSCVLDWLGQNGGKWQCHRKNGRANESIEKIFGRQTDRRIIIELDTTRRRFPQTLRWINTVDLANLPVWWRCGATCPRDDRGKTLGPALY